jgi:hypothetical protein
MKNREQRNGNWQLTLSCRACTRADKPQPISPRMGQIYKHITCIKVGFKL